MSSTQINLSWTASTDNVAVTGYLVERCAGASCTNFAQVATPTTTSYSNSGLTAGTTYRYRVRARDAVPNHSAYAGPVNATTSAGADVSAPTVPTNLTVIVGSNNIVIAWQASTDDRGVDSYELQRCAGTGCTFSTIASVFAPTTAFTDTNTTFGTTYAYRVRAKDAASNASAYVTSSTVTAGECE
jgi:predicted phage tail protein